MLKKRRIWSEEEDQRLMEMIARGRARHGIAASLRRSRSAVAGRLKLLRSLQKSAQTLATSLPTRRYHFPAVLERKMTNNNTENVDRAWELMRKVGFAMLVTRDGDKLRARPMSAYLDRENNAIYF